MRRAVWIVPLVALAVGAALVVWRASTARPAPVHGPEAPPAPASPGPTPVAPSRTPAPASLPGGSIRILVRFDGKPVEGADVDIRSAATNRHEHFETKASGSRDILNMPPDEYRIGVRHPKYLPQAARVQPEPGKLIEVVFNLKEGGTLTGLVVDGAGTPLPGTHVLLQDAAAEGPIDIQFQVQTDEAGKYAMSGVPSGDFKVRFRHDRYRAQSLPVSFPTLGDNRELNAVLVPGSRMAGRVVDEATGAPLEGATVSASNEETAGVQTDKEGRFEIHGMGDKPIHCFASAVGYGTVRLQAVPANSTDVLFRLPKGAILGGRLEGSALPHQYTVTLLRIEEEGQPYPYRSRGFGNDPRATFLFGSVVQDELVGSLLPGRYRVEVEAVGYEVLDKPELRLGAGEAKLDLLIRVRKSN